MTEEWFVGFVDGEGCFMLDCHIVRTGVNAGRWACNVKLDICQAARDIDVLYRLRDFLGMGTVRQSHAERMGIWRVSRQDDIERLVEIFDRHPLQTAKRQDFEIWKRAVAVKGRFKCGGAGGASNDGVRAEIIALTAEMRELRDERRATHRSVGSEPLLAAASR